MRILFTTALLVLLPAIVYANAGTPLLMFGALHLFSGNFFLGIYEMILLQRWRKRDSRFLEPVVLILANYVSMSAGIGLAFLIGYRLGLNFFNPSNSSNYIFQYLLYYSGFTIMSMVVELPFFSILLKEFTLKQKLKITVTINSISALTVIVLSLLFQSLVLFI